MLILPPPTVLDKYCLGRTLSILVGVSHLLQTHLLGSLSCVPSKTSQH